MKERIARIHERMEKACTKANRGIDEVTLIAVSKYKPASDIEEARELGLTHFGESYVQEWIEKSSFLSEEKQLDLHWHFIGRLQRNKCKFVAGKVDLIHSVNTFKLLHEIERRTPDGLRQPVLLQCNLGEEDSKAGFRTFEELHACLAPESPWEKVEIQGLMALPPYEEDPEDVRPHFQKLRHWKEQLEKELESHLPVLSMGMSHDLEIAIEEGATMIRVGSAIFGARE